MASIVNKLSSTILNEGTDQLSFCVALSVHIVKVSTDD